MPEETDPEFIVCLGSSCFARGNSQNLAAIEAYLQGRGLQDSVRGCLCQDECKLGPNISVCGTHHHEVTAAQLREIFQQLNNGTR